VTFLYVIDAGKGRGFTSVRKVGLGFGGAPGEVLGPDGLSLVLANGPLGERELAVEMVTRIEAPLDISPRGQPAAKATRDQAYLCFGVS
jgi:hypothetical protein